MQINVEKTKIMGISRQPCPAQIVIDKKQADSVEYSNYLGSMITNDARYMIHVKLNPESP
jgi:hypothetical protein